jgi:peptidyl-tRNA hydrolase, PTH1 family
MAKARLGARRTGSARRRVRGAADNRRMIRLLVGLGNPGPQYAATRHNAGFWWLDEAARKLSVSLRSERGYRGLLGRFNAPSGPVLLLEPMTFMNLSGESVASVARYFRIAPSEILVIHDDLDLAPGQMKLKFGGGHGGHNGLRDIHSNLATADYWRLRLGIGHPGVKDEVADYVLRDPSKEDHDAILRCIDQSLAALDSLITGDMQRATMTIHAKPARPKPPRRDVPAAASTPEGPA